ncbi:MAG: type II toxin-antitoxin system Phd/YefM family antitoxin [Lachnospiraceae bacterium]|nr:type II toxin-antitoxin system Phd/YefM family antitoxin [Lachnospiraceae bacterium]
MNINTDNLVSITEANQNFSRVARMVDENGPVVILKNNSPRYILIEFDEVKKEHLAKDETLLEISSRLIEKNREAYEVLAK